MALYASGVQIPTDLSGAMSGVGTPAYNAIGANYAGAKKKLMNDAQSRGMNGAAAVGPNSYAGQRLGATQGLDVGNLEASLGQGIGNTAYQNTLHQRDFGQQEQLAEEAADLNRPSLLEQVLQGIGSVGKPIATYAGMSGKGGGGGSPKSPSVPSPYDYLDLG